MLTKIIARVIQGFVVVCRGLQKGSEGTFTEVFLRKDFISIISRNLYK